MEILHAAPPPARGGGRAGSVSGPRKKPLMAPLPPLPCLLWSLVPCRTRTEAAQGHPGGRPPLSTFPNHHVTGAQAGTAIPGATLQQGGGGCGTTASRADGQILLSDTVPV